MKVLVVHGSARGGTEGVADRIAATLRTEGHDAQSRPARNAHDLGAIEAVVVGGALYALHWHEDARRFVLRHHRALRARRVYFFSSGPLDDSASRAPIPPAPEVERLMRYVGARGHVTFGGRLAPDAKGFAASAMAKKQAGDYRDPAQIESWARELAARLRAPDEARPAIVALPSRALPLGLSLLLALTALPGGAALIARPDGSAIGLPLSLLAHSPFASFLVPGLLLFALVGLPAAWTSFRHAIRDPYAGFASALTGASLTIWMIVQMTMLRSAHPLQLAYLALGLAILVDAAIRVHALVAEWRHAMPARSELPHAKGA